MTDPTPPCPGCSSPLCPDCRPTTNGPVRLPIGEPLTEAETYFRIYFAPTSEGGKLARLLMDEYDGRGRTIRRQRVANLRLQQERDKALARLANALAEVDALRHGVADDELAARLLDGAEQIVAPAGATLTAGALRAAAHRLMSLPAELADALARHVLHGPAAADTEQETTHP